MSNVIIMDECLNFPTEQHRIYHEYQQIQLRRLMKHNRLRQGISEELHKLIWGY